jgi:predicted PurR-regulated permease PerM
MSDADRSFARRALIVVALLGLAALVCYIAHVLLLAFAGLLGAVFLDALAEWVCDHTRLSRTGSYFTVLAIAVIVVGIACWILVPRVVVQLSELSQAVPAGIKNIQKWLNSTTAGKIIASHSQPILTSMAGRLSQLGFAVADGTVAIVVAVVLAAYFAATPSAYRHGVLMLVPAAQRHKADLLFEDLTRTLGWWMIGQSVPMVVLGIATMIGLLIIHVPLAFTLSIFTAFMIFIPFVGAILAFLATALVTVSADPGKLPLVAIIFVGGGRW